MAAHDFLGPYQLIPRSRDLAHSREDDPECYSACDNRIENRPLGEDYQESGQHGSKRHVYVTHIVNVGEPDRGVVTPRLPQQPRHPQFAAAAAVPTTIGIAPSTGMGCDAEIAPRPATPERR